MFPVSEANFFSEKKTGFLSLSGHKTAVAIVSDFVKGGLGCNGGGVGLRRYDDNGGDGGDWRRRTS